MIELASLKNGLSKAGRSEAQEKQTEGGDHSYHPEVPRCKEPSEDDSGDRLNAKSQSTRKHRDPGTSNRKAPEAVAVRGRVEGAVCIEWLQTSSRDRPTCGLNPCSAALVLVLARRAAWGTIVT